MSVGTWILAIIWVVGACYVWFRIWQNEKPEREFNRRLIQKRLWFEGKAEWPGYK